MEKEPKSVYVWNPFALTYLFQHLGKWVCGLGLEVPAKSTRESAGACRWTQEQALER